MTRSLTSSLSHLTRALAAFLLLACMSCATPEAVFSQLNPMSQGQETGAPGKKVGPKTREEARREAEAKKAGSVNVDVKEVASHLQSAERDVKLRFQGFLNREPMKFSTKRLWRSLKKMVAREANLLAHLDRALARASWHDLLLSLYSLLLTLLFIVGFALADKQLMTMAMRAQGMQHLRLPVWVTQVLRAGIALLGHIGACAAFLLLSYFPVQALFDAHIWAKALTSTFWVLLVYRLIEGGVALTFALPMFALSDEQNKKLHRRLYLGLRIAALAYLLLSLTRLFMLPPQIGDALGFAFQVIMAFLPILLSTLHDDLLAALPRGERGSAYAGLRRIIDRYFYWFLLLTVGMLVMRAFGYVHASNFILARGYGLFAFLTLTSLLFSKGRAASAKYLTKYDANDAQGELLRSVRTLMMGLCGLLIFIFSLKIVGLHEPFILLLKTPLLSIQSVEFSLYNVFNAALIVGAASLVSKCLRAALNARIYPSLGIEIGVAYAVNTLIGYAIIILGFFLVLIALGVNLSALTVVIASLSVGIGFGLQTLTENLVSGFIILFGRAVRKGDFISVNNVYGRVEAVGARSVVVRTMDNYDLLIPSKALVGGTIINWTYRDSLIRMHLPVGVSYKADPHQVETLLLEAASRHQHVLEAPRPEVWFVALGDSSINFELLVYFDCRVTVADRLRGELYFHVWDVLIEAGVQIPFPQRDLHLHSADFVPQLQDMLEHLRRSDPTQQGGPKLSGSSPDESSE